jgi:hypothetical protein
VRIPIFLTHYVADEQTLVVGPVGVLDTKQVVISGSRWLPLVRAGYFEGSDSVVSSEPGAGVLSMYVHDD